MKENYKIKSFNAQCFGNWIGSSWNNQRIHFHATKTSSVNKKTYQNVLLHAAVRNTSSGFSKCLKTRSKSRIQKSSSLKKWMLSFENV